MLRLALILFLVLLSYKPAGLRGQQNKTSQIHSLFSIQPEQAGP
jgi:hypothetical protein